MPFDFPDISERRGNQFERFLLFLEQLEEAVRLLKTGRIALQRMALVALDTLAEVLLFRQVDLLFFMSDEAWNGQPRAYDAAERRRARERFNKRVDLAIETFEGIWKLRYPPPILDEDDAAIFRTAHHYRNPVYHRDRHNAALIAPVCNLYAQAIGRAFVRSQREGYAVSCSPSYLEELRRLGWKAKRDRYFHPRDAAEVIVARICAGLEVDVNSLRGNLAEDISFRCAVVDEDIAGLHRDGLSDEGIHEFLLNAQDWAANRGDETELRLRSEHQALLDTAMASGQFDKATAEAMRDVERRQWEHLFGPERTPVIRVDLNSHKEMAVRGERLRIWQGSLSGLLRSYQRIDEELEILESAMDFIIMQWDRRLQMELDMRRGK